MSDIVITGMGVISAIGLDTAAFERNLFSGTCGIGVKEFNYRNAPVRFPVAEVDGFDPLIYLDRKKLPLMDRFSQFAVAAAKQAWDDAGCNKIPALGERTAVITGTGVGGQNTIEESYMRLLDVSNSPRVHPFTIPRFMANAGSSQISIELGITGPSFTIVSACASSIHAMGVAVQMLRSGLVDRVVTGGAEACLTFGTLKSWESLRVMSPDVPRPFSRDRAGMVIGEGAAMFVIETRDSAEKRGAKIYADFAGFGMSSDARDITSPDAEGASRAITAALLDAGIVPTDVDYINAHGTGTRINDSTETAAIRLALGSHADKVAVSSSKSMFGHALGAAGALEMLATVLSVRRDLAPPTINYLGQDPECDLDYVTHTARAMPINVALNNSFAFGGMNAVVVVKKNV